MKIIREKLNRLLEKKAFYIVFAIIASIILWVYVAYVENPDVDVTIANIPVTFLNEDVLEDNGLILTNIDRRSFTVKFTGKRNNVTRLNDSNVELTVDMSDILRMGGMPGSYQLSYSIIYPINVNRASITDSTSGARYVTATVENRMEVTVPVRCNYDGDVAEGFIAEPIQYSPDVITVSGPEAVVSTIDYALVNIQRDVISETLQVQTGAVLIDKEGNAVNDAGLTLTPELIDVTIPVAVEKEIALNVNLLYSASATEDNVICTVTPDTLTLSGEAEDLDVLNGLTIKTIDLTDFISIYSEKIEIPMPAGVENVSGTTTATVSVLIQGVGTAKVTATDFSVRNENAGYVSTVVTQSLEVTLRGKDDSAEHVNPENVRVIADMAEIGNSEGTFTVPAIIMVDGTTTVDAIGDYTVTVVVTKE